LDIKKVDRRKNDRRPQHHHAQYLRKCHLLPDHGGHPPGVLRGENSGDAGRGAEEEDAGVRTVGPEDQVRHQGANLKDVGQYNRD